KLFGKNNVTATMNLRQISSMDDLKSNEHLIEIKDPSYFAKSKDQYTGGESLLGGKYIAMNAKVFDSKTGIAQAQGALTHEIGHTGGLLHPFEFDKAETFMNGKQVPVNLQGYSNPGNEMDIEANFMNYPSRAAANFPWGDKKQLQQYFMNNPTSTPGQGNQVIENYNQGNLNNNSDVSARAILQRINNLFNVK
ncbi:hypothetical protein ACDQ55_21185, partial [Chitinophaga sp. 30R24]|uniref:hypothetical protein n=1 Tax=Chitinophaga sp. 30R24 TaxID=3248838 RepID=UPI003B90B94B